MIGKWDAIVYLNIVSDDCSCHITTQQVHEASESDVRIASFLLGKCPQNKTSEVCEIARFCPQRRHHVHATFMTRGKRPPPPVALAECILVKEVERHWSIFTLRSRSLSIMK